MTLGAWRLGLFGIFIFYFLKKLLKIDFWIFDFIIYLSHIADMLAHVVSHLSEDLVDAFESVNTIALDAEGVELGRL